MTTDQKTEWEQLMEQDLPTVQPPTYLKEGDVINKGVTEEAPLPLGVSDLRFKGYVEVWDTITGVQSLQPRWLMWQTMKKTREDGSQVFTTTDPQIPQNHGADLFCPFNPMSPEYQEMKGMGFKDCRKHHIPHLDGLMSHVRKSHKRGWDAMERKRTEREREEDRTSQRELTEAIKLAVVGGVQAGTNKSLTDQNQVLEAIQQLATTANIPLPDDDFIIQQIDPVSGLTHTHAYKGKKAGAACKIDGCEVVRSTDAKTRAKKA